MTDPLALLGLEPGADERAVKRAYARRLPGARPDVDPAGFQALHDAYERALALVRAATAAPGGRSDEGADGERHRAAPARPDDADRPPAPPEAAGGNPGVPAFSIDLGLLLPALLERAARATPDELGAWIAAETAQWPIAAKPAVAPHLLACLADEPIDLTPEQLDAVAGGFGLDDVALGLDPVLLAGLRSRLEARRHAAEVAARLRPDRRGALCRHMRRRDVGGYLGLDTRLMMAVLTGPGALARARALQFVPLVPGSVWRFVARIDGGRVDTLSPAIHPEVVEVWRKADRRRAALKPYRRWALLVAVVAGILASVALSPPSSDPPLAPPERPTDRALFDEGEARAAAGESGLASGAFETLIARHPPPVPRSAERIVARAYLAKGAALAGSGWPQEARATYRDMDAALSPPSDPSTRPLLAEALNDRGDLDLAAGSLDTAWNSYAAVVSRYGAATVAEADVEAQVARALVGEARSAAPRLRFGDAAAACAALKGRMTSAVPASVRADAEAACGARP